MFKRSSFCSLGNCAEVSELPSGGIAVRNSRHPSLCLAFSREEWVAFVAGIKAGEFDVEQV